MTSIVGNRTLSTFLEFHAATRPHEVALVAETQAGVRQMLTWSELDARANQTACWILEQGLKHGDSIALCLPNCFRGLSSLVGGRKDGNRRGSYRPWIHATGA